MKKTFLAIIATTAAMVCGAVNSNDTVYRFSNPERVLISESREGVEVKIIDDNSVKHKFERHGEGNFVRRSSQTYKFLPGGDKWNMIIGGFTLGFVTTPGAGDDVSPEGGRSLELGILNALGFEYKPSKHFGISFGIGFDWRNYRSTKGILYEPVDGKIRVSQFPEGVDYRFSRLKVFSIQFPLLIGWDCGRIASGLNPNISFGPVFCVNTHGSVKSSWREEGGKTSTFSSNSIGQRKFTIDFIANFSLGCVGVYVRYSPYKTLTGAEAPDLRPLSAGFAVSF